MLFISHQMHEQHQQTQPDTTDNKADDLQFTRKMLATYGYHRHDLSLINVLIVILSLMMAAIYILSRIF